MDNTIPSLDVFFNPKAIAIIGASADTGKLGYSIARNLVNIGYPGAIYFVNPRSGELFGRPIYPSLEQVTGPVDLAVLLIPAPATPQAMHDCGRHGVQAVIVASGGFRETGTEGANLEHELLAIARQYHMRLIGPNCIGLIDTHYPIDTTFLRPPSPPKGSLAFISHSGATCAAVVDWSRGQGFGFSRLVSLGNQIDINETDTLLSTAADPDTHSIALYLESISDGRRFVEAARQVTIHKPVVALKSGRSVGGQRAAASHTGALAGKEAAYDAAFQKAGVIRANSVEELFEWTRTLASCPLPAGRSMAVLTDAGGMGVTASDALEANGLQLADLTEGTRAGLKVILPPAASTQNPVDMLASATPEQYAACLSLLLADPNVNGVIIILLPPPIHPGNVTAQALVPVIKASAKPVLTVVVGHQLIQDALEVFHSQQIPEFRFPERAAAALAALVQRAEYLANNAMDTASAERIAPQGLSLLKQASLPDNIEKILNAYGVSTLQCILATNREEAARVAEAIGFPVVIKIASPDLTHKSDVGGVMLNLKDGKAVQEGYDVLMGNVRTANPHARVHGVMIQPMAANGQEVILGAIQDPMFGPLVMFGSGGVEVEGLKDIAFALAPLNRREADELIDRTWAGQKLRGYRNLAPADREAVVQAVIGLAQLALDFPELSEIEINPLRVLPVGQGVIALDVRTASS